MATFPSRFGTAESGQIEVTRKLQRDLSSIDILIQNAATFMAGPLEQAKLEDLDAIYRTNVRAAFALTQALLPMLKARRGQIVFERCIHREAMYRH